MTVGLAYLDAACKSQINKGTNMINAGGPSSSWLTFAHELGHNLAGDHSFEEGQGSTGGIMDYSDGKHEGVYQFNTKYRKRDMCAYLDKYDGNCQGKFSPTQVTGTNPKPRGNTCKTLDGTPCMLPFMYRDLQHETCTVDNSEMLWCYTSKNRWGYCKCCNYMTVDGKKCVFPFKYRGTQYDTCTTAQHTHAWCATGVDDDLENTGWGNCDTSCK